MNKISDLQIEKKVEPKFYCFIKRLVDILVAFLGIVILFPIFLIISVAIKIDSDGPIIFSQKRYGINKTIFCIYKFRTMNISAPQNVATRDLADSHIYITKLGHILRKTSLDELPQLVNILKGEMSVIGPRPVILEEFDLIEERDKYGANSVKPGLTGWAQVNGRDKLDNKVKAKYDGQYVENFGVIIDLKCFLKTILLVFKREDIIEGNLENNYDKDGREATCLKEEHF
ncbi:sugar transferase [Intestinibacter sp.]